MTLNIIHLLRWSDRWDLLQKEIREQGFADYRIWEGIDDTINPNAGIVKAQQQIVTAANEQNPPFV